MVRTTRTAALLAALTVLLACSGCLGLAEDAASTETTVPPATPTEVPTPTPDPTATATSDGTTTAEATPGQNTTTDPTDTPVGPSATFVGDGETLATVTLEVADNDSERAHGLMHRESLAADHGMVFVYPDADRRTFWMKNTLVPLDMIFVGPDGTVLNVRHASVPPEGSSDYGSYSSDGDAQYVVEVNRGFANETGIEPGTRVEFSGLNTTVDD
ncbi:DUF192 domain-containing protein [Halomarina oriensis]|uniref:DUF192 domain-containing protein n=1 Tax=Halomarina oriensis TaxID=671145 RepID=A0A6B0GT64_9EURY|nr:DUF192 domain-containing protein [Halomarina oriensis]MWG34898.1 hypothetical protein [Halomarina oriensis]